MCQTAINLISGALHEVANAEVLLKIKNIIALFIQTMHVGKSLLFWILAAKSRQSWDYPVGALDSFLLVLFDKYAELLKRRFSDDFHEVSVLLKFYSLILIHVDEDCLNRRLYAYGNQQIG